MPITEHQRRLRRNHLGGSDAPAIVSLSPWATRSSIYWSKVLETEDDEPTEAMQTGNRMETPLLDFATDRLTTALLRNQFRVSRGSDAGIMAANFDALVLDAPEAIECKYVGPDAADGWGREGTDEVPDHVIVQCQHQMHVGELDRVWVAAAIAGYRLDWKLFCVPRAQAMIDELVVREVQFWKQHVEQRVPPSDDPPPLEIVKRIRRQPGTVKVLDDRGLAAVAELGAAKLAKAYAEDREERAKATVLSLLEANEGGLLPDGRLVTYLLQRGKPKFDLRRLRAEHPAIYDAFAVETSHRVLLVRNKPKESK